jgi:protein-S-isoprenylcysteine O-methyltransferase Ste14
MRTALAEGTEAIIREMPVRYPLLSSLVNVFVMVVVAGGWIAFGGALIFRFWKSSAQPGKGDRASLFGLALQLLGIALVWFVHRPYASAIVPVNLILEVLLALAALVAAVFSAWLGIAAVRALGKQWSLTARVLEDHKLVTGGPYRLARHPLYTALLGMILATGLAVSYWVVLGMALLVYWSGTAIRIRSEERLLREEFGAEYEEFARRVPALLPRLF